jgi:guanosine-3',5'-bis(diphosphate) 3'-pyrophosphohydrolase
MFSASASSSTSRGRLLSRARYRPSQVEHRAGPLQGLHLDAEAERLPLDPHHHRRPVQAARRTADTHAPRCRNVAEYGVAAHAIYKDNAVAGKANGHDEAVISLSKDSNAYAWLRHTIESLSEGDNPEDFLEHTKLELFQDQVFCFTPERPADRAAARRDAGRFRLCGAYRHRQFLRRRQDQRPHHAAGDRLAERRRGGDRALQRADAAGRPGNMSSSPARRVRRSGGQLKRMAVRKQYSGLGMRILERTFERAGKENRCHATGPEARFCTGSATRRSRTC